MHALRFTIELVCRVVLPITTSCVTNCGIDDKLVNVEFCSPSATTMKNIMLTETVDTTL